MKVFVDSNVLFSAALGGQPFLLLWDIARAGKVQLVTTAYCHTEASDNLKHKRPDALECYATLMASVYEVPEDQSELAWAGELVPAKDAPILAAAVAAGADVLVTGDRRHFGQLPERNDLPLRVRTIRAFLLEGPKQPPSVSAPGQGRGPPGDAGDDLPPQPRLHRQPPSPGMATREGRGIISSGGGRS